MSEKRIPVRVDFSQAKQQLINFSNDIEVKVGAVARRTLGILGMIATATGTTAGRSISMVISGALTSAALLQQIAQIQSTNPFTAAFGALTLMQLPLLWYGVLDALAEQTQVEAQIATTSTILSQMSMLIGTVSYR